MDTQQKLSIDHILATVAEQRASDLHFSVGSPPILRIDEKLVTIDDVAIVTKEFMEEFVASFLDTDQLRTLHENREVILAYQYQKQARFRVNIFYQKGVLAAYFRLIGNRIPPLEQLGLPPILQQLAGLPEGLIIISGSFGSGKTTTAASIIEHVNQERSAYILTVERPIEYIFANRRSIIEQREVGRDAVSFESALATTTQEDVNVLFLSELPSAAVIRQVLTIAGSGRLVLANLEADTVAKSLELITNSFPSNEQQQVREQLSLVLAGIVCQRLVPRIGGGQIAVAEVLTSTPPVRALLKEGSFYQLGNIIQTSRAEGMVPLDWSLAELVKLNQITIEEALEKAVDPQQLRYMLRT
ncbi:MAG: PilT/PilU family type 4a pilus ATPase [Patescibacteria group bacterium]